MVIEIITPEKTIFKGEAKLVRVPGTLGSFAMMRNHRPTISTLEPGIIKIVLPDKEKFFELLDKGVVEQHDNRISILCENIKETSSSII